ncbi:hypothetical protein HMPREF9248_1192 [Fannyhessea vaginae PB189-T1-4]|uniref:Uncharacterized protein n=1 Tax=Fannyhessea vaginae PB189-T1-4 TaxID=866774 RepID=A0ABN0B1A4_9ACTN|nr:hypothetical protein [Fannyhessea vaginae]EFL44557.1 hypothetical protein HMPREF9248_1192 [Fannyhessea vaginae PB189-T1-4]
MSWNNTDNRPSQVPFTLVGVRLRPRVPMMYMAGLPYICALGVWDVCYKTLNHRARIHWPYRVEVEVYYEWLRFDVQTHGGCDDNGVFVDVDIVCTGDTPTLQTLPFNFDVDVAAAVQERVRVWEHACRADKPLAGALAPVMDEYFSLISLIGKPVCMQRGPEQLGARGVDSPCVDDAYEEGGCACDGGAGVAGADDGAAGAGSGAGNGAGEQYTFAGIDAWGRAHLLSQRGEEIECAPEQVSVVAL